MRPRVFLNGLIALVAGLLVGQASLAGTIAGSKHDFSTKGWGTDQLCVFCHAPHNTTGGTPLWNHASTSATYTLYTSSTLTATLGSPAAGGVSKLCLSCHDGTVAVDSYATRTGTTFATGTALLGTDLGNDHPIAFTYDAALATADGGLVTPASATQVVANVPLFSGKLECATCHNVHDPGPGSFLRVSNAGSALCLKCHSK